MRGLTRRSYFTRHSPGPGIVGTPYHRLQHRRSTFDEVATLSVEGLNNPQPFETGISGHGSGRSWENDLLEPPTGLKNGEILLSDQPGLGSKLNEKLLASKRLE